MISVLAVDDEEAHLDLTKQFLEMEGGMDVRTVTSASEALELIRSVHFDAVVSDYQMPIMNGIEFLKALRRDTSDIPFIIFTGKSREEVVVQALQLGADFYIMKGTDVRSQFAELANAIRKLVEKGRMEASLRRGAKRFGILEESFSDIIVLIDSHMEVTYISPSVERVLGIAPEDVFKNPFSYVVDPEATKEVAEIVKDVLSRPGSSTRFELEVKHGDGSIKTLDCAVSRGTNNIEEPMIVLTARDITTEKRAGLEARKFKQAIDTSFNAFAMADLDRKMVYANESFLELWGVDREEVLGRPFVDFWEDPTQVMGVVNELQETGLWAGEMRGIRNDGVPFDSMVSASLIRDGRGEPAMLMSHFLDISEIKREQRRVLGILDGMKDLSERLGEPFLIVDQDSRIVFCNGVATTLLDLPLFMKWEEHRVYLEEMGAPREFKELLAKTIGKKRQMTYSIPNSNELVETFEILSHPYGNETLIYMRRVPDQS